MKKDTDASVQMSILPTADLDWNGEPGSKPPFIDSRARAGPKNLDVKYASIRRQGDTK